jgi:tetratricopeptide (TPR) repeat protein
MVQRRIRLLALALLFLSGVLAGCNQLITSREAQLSKEADAKAAEGDFAQAINLYEKALEGTTASAEIHYKLALIYDDKMQDPLNAMHHFKRFLAFEPTGKRAEEVKQFMKRDQLALMTSLTNDSMVPRADLVRLNNENLRLREQLGERWAAQKLAAAKEKERARQKPNDPAKKVEKPQHYTVQSGDTLASIARKFYHHSAGWHRILEANSDTISKPGDLKPGQVLVIP